DVTSVRYTVGRAGEPIPLVGLLVLNELGDGAVTVHCGLECEVAGHHPDLLRHHTARAGGEIGPALSHVQVPNIDCNADFSAAVTVRCQYALTATQLCAYWHQYAVFGGFHCDGSWSPFDRFDPA